jgi:membrane-associated phospholipid phosphatase
MTLVTLLLKVSAIVILMLLVGLFGIVGIDRIRAFWPRATQRLRLVFPYLLLFGLVLAVNSVLRDIGPKLSWIIGWRITGWITAIEGTLVATIQGYAHPALTAYFSYIYIYGYIFLLVFPILAYLMLPNTRPIREAVLAYSLNYAIGVTCYILFIAYGPRNVMPDLVDQLLYTNWPESQLLTSEVNTNVNVFPSLHTSLAATVAALAYRTREQYPRWLPISIFLALSVTLSTMYLGIHWGIDVVAGVVLAGISVAGSIWLTSPERQNERIGRLGTRLRALVDRPIGYLLGLLRSQNES